MDRGRDVDGFLNLYYNLLTTKTIHLASRDSVQSSGQQPSVITQHFLFFQSPMAKHARFMVLVMKEKEMSETIKLMQCRAEIVCTRP